MIQSWDTPRILHPDVGEPRSCQEGFYSSSNGLGNCCDLSDCDFITECDAGTAFFASETPYFCGFCGTGTIYNSAGDQNPALMFNCDGDWEATRTVSLPATFNTSVPAASPTDYVVSVNNPAYEQPVGTAQETGVSTRVLSSSFNSQPSESAGTGNSTDASASSSTSQSGPNKTSKSSVNIPLVVGVTVGGVAVLASICLAAFFIFKHHSNKQQTPQAPAAQPFSNQPGNSGNAGIEYSNGTYMNGAASGGHDPNMPMPPNYWQGAGAYVQNQGHPEWKGPYVETTQAPPPTPPYSAYYQPPARSHEVLGSVPQYPSELPAHNQR
ncbi:hypothetical protein NA57DRAFT_78316 [Rhizodiscina lignyota]|uniref:Uncharacterized protein n=1 Tax=Rhizodiscina lignyota TaxID=1504668 RepID=A0A9P4ICF8_9PEZI|nr:hypothetical protein NA57DRAFT_78316 [Rhizodiscina lignyota]